MNVDLTITQLDKSLIYNADFVIKFLESKSCVLVKTGEKKFVLSFLGISNLPYVNRGKQSLATTPSIKLKWSVLKTILSTSGMPIPFEDQKFQTEIIVNNLSLRFSFTPTINYL